MPISISKQYSFDSAHQLWNDNFTAEDNAKVFGKCAKLHGHTYVLTVEVSGPVVPETGMIMNYFHLDNVVKPYVDDMLDHKFLNDEWPGMLTTAENMVTIIKEHFKPVFDYMSIQLESVTLQETPKTKATWRR